MDVIALSKVQGKPFYRAEILGKIEARIMESKPHVH